MLCCLAKKAGPAAQSDSRGCRLSMSHRIGRQMRKLLAQPWPPSAGVEPFHGRVRRCGKQDSSTVELIYSTGQQARLVKGKWLPGYLDGLLTRHFAGSPIGARDFQKKIVSALLLTLDFQDTWAAGYRRKLEVLL